MTDNLIDRLVADLAPVPPHALARRLAAYLAIAVVVSTLGTVIWLGVRPDLSAASATASFWSKLGYTALLALVGVWATSRLARPEADVSVPFTVAVGTVLSMLAAAVAVFIATPEEGRRDIVMGGSALLCPFYIFAVSVPLLVAALAFLRGMAPTRLMLAGAAAGLMAGALGASVYALHCTEWSVAFVAVWYSLGILSVAAAGALAGRLALRW